MPNKETFKIKPIKELIWKYKKGTYTDLDPFPFDYKEDATTYMKTIKDDFIDLGLFDPPYSPRQLKECYKGKGEYDTKSSTWSNWKNLYASKIKTGGISICFGWNTNGLGKTRGFEIVEILMVAHGGMHNDTICIVERKVQSKLKTRGKTKRYSLDYERINRVKRHSTQEIPIEQEAHVT